MFQLPRGPLQPATERQHVIAGCISGLAGVSFLAFAVWLASVAYSNGRLGQPGVMLINGIAGLIGFGCLNAAAQFLRRKEQRRSHLLGARVLYLIGTFFLVVPPIVLLAAIAKGTKMEIRHIGALVSVFGFGFLVIRLARIRGKSDSPNPP